MTVSIERRDEIVKRVYLLRAQIKDAETEVKELLKEADFAVDNFVSGHLLVNVTATKRFDGSLAEKVLKKADYALIQKSVPDAAKAKALFPEKYDAMQKVSGVTVNIKMGD